MPDEYARLPRLTYPLRAGGMGLGALAVMMVLYELDASLARWALVVLGAFIWPHVAYLWSSRSKHPRRAEVRNLLIDSAIVGAFVPLMEFNLLPSVLLVTLTIVDKVAIGVQGLWLRSVPGMLGAALAVAVCTGGSAVPESSMAVVLACLPVLVLHTLSVSLVSYKLIRRVSQQNQQLDALQRIDPLTGLYGRTHWEQQVQQALKRHRGTGEPAALLMLDLDGFKTINDAWGHTVGDDVIRALSLILCGCVRASDCAGRYGGDEFAVLLQCTSLDQAQDIAQRICAQAEAHQFIDRPELRFTCSIGIAVASSRHATPREWVAEADAALYRAKNGGRNQVVSTDEVALHPLAEA
jgi:diguanylate cyclase